MFALLAFPGAFGDTSKEVQDAVRYAHIREQVSAPNVDLLKARPLLEEAVKIYSQDGDLWWQLGQARLLAKEYDGCIGATLDALRFGAFSINFKASAMYEIACAYALKGERDKSFEWLKKSMDGGYRDLQHIRTDRNLDSLHSDKRWEETAATKDVLKMSRNEGWRYDLWLINREVSRIHYNPYTRYTKAQQEAWVRDLDRRIPTMTDHQIQVAFMKYMRHLSDGHSSIRPEQPPRYPVLPMQVFLFEEGVFVTSAAPSLKELVGTRIVKIEGKPIETVLAKLDEITPQDNPQELKSLAPRFLVNPGILHGLGLMADKDEEELSFIDSDGNERSRTVKGVVDRSQTDWLSARDTAEAASPLYLKHRDKPFWFEPLPNLKAVYAQYNQVHDDIAETTQKFAERLFDYIDKNDVDTLIVDVRWNGGGNSFLNLPLVNGIIGCKKIRAHGHLFVITGRNTFSAAQNFTTDIGRACDTLFVGEPTGSSPNFVGETVRFTLPFSKMEGSVSDLYWQRSWPMDNRTWIAPDLPVMPTFALFKANRDQAMEAIAAYIESRPQGDGKPSGS